jgi:NTP pyrophosphatase (non-canonical NTP hydrolase)
MLSWRERADIIHRTVASGLKHYTKEDARFLAVFLAGEVGELCNLIKKEWMEEFGVAKSQGDKREAIKFELADVRISLELLAKCFDVNLERACGEKLTICEARWPEAGEAVLKAERAKTSTKRATPEEQRDAMSQACELLSNWVDVQGAEYSNLAYDSMAIVKRWQRGDFLE